MSLICNLIFSTHASLCSHVPSQHANIGRMNLNGRHNFRAENILQAVDQLGINMEGSLLDGAFRGGQCQVFRISFRHNIRQSLAVRVPLYMNPDAMTTALQSEILNLNILAAKGFHWAPKYHGASLRFDNAIEHPFIVLSWVEGSQLEWNETFPARPLRDHILAQLAAVQLHLIECTLEESKWRIQQNSKHMLTRPCTRFVVGSGVFSETP